MHYLNYSANDWLLFCFWLNNLQLKTGKISCCVMIFLRLCPTEYKLKPETTSTNHKKLRKLTNYCIFCITITIFVSNWSIKYVYDYAMKMIILCYLIIILFNNYIMKIIILCSTTEWVTKRLKIDIYLN